MVFPQALDKRKGRPGLIISELNKSESMTLAALAWVQQLSIARVPGFDPKINVCRFKTLSVDPERFNNFCG